LSIKHLKNSSNLYSFPMPKPLLHCCYNSSPPPANRICICFLWCGSKFEAVRIYCLRDLGLKVQSKCQYGQFLLEALRENLLHGSDGCWQSSVYVDLYTHHSNHLLLCVSISKSFIFLSLTRIFAIVFKAIPESSRISCQNPKLNGIYKDLLSN
jgi:hypothetical protein